MAEAPEPPINLIAQALLQWLRKIGKDGTQDWLTEPRTVEMFRGVADAQLPRPSLFLEIKGRNPDWPNASNTVREMSTLLVRGWAEHPLDPSGEIQRLMADVELQVRRQVYLTNPSTGVGVTVGGFIRPGRCESAVEQVEGKSGLGEGWIEIFASYQKTVT